MDNSSDSFRGELDSLTITSTDSLQLITDEFRLHSSTPDVSNVELSKRVALLELENERLRINLENVRIDLNARIAANQGLKGKITELFVEMQTVLQEKQKTQNILTDTNNRLSAADASAKWYQSQLHILMASKNSLQVEIDTYQGILKQRQQAIADINLSYKQLNADYIELVQQYQKEKREMQNTIKDLQSHIQSISTVDDVLDKNSTCSPSDISMILEATEDELRNTKAELKTLEQRLLSCEVVKMSMENALSKQRILISTMEENMQKCETEKNTTADVLRRTQFEIQKLQSENELLQISLFTCKRDQNQVEEAISQLRIQLTKMIAQYKLLKTKNTESEEKLNSMQDLVNENKRLKILSCKANSVLLKKFKEEKYKIRDLEQKLYGKQKNKTGDSLNKCSKQILLKNKDLQDQLKLLTVDESIDEGYGDNSIISPLDIPPLSPINPVLLNAAADVLERSKDFHLPIQVELDTLQLKMEKFRDMCNTLHQQKNFHSNIPI